MSELILHRPDRRRIVRMLLAGWVIGLGLSSPSLAQKGGGIAGSNTLPTTEQDFFQPGTQILGAGVPGAFASMHNTDQCVSCHSNFGPSDPFLMGDEFNTWSVSMMGQSARDPLFHAGLVIANQDAAGAGEYCIRCHAPNAWLSGHVVPPDTSTFTATDFQGVSCNFCHRLVNPEYVAGTSPPQDEQIVNDLIGAGLLPPQGSNARYTVDPVDNRRGPFSNVPANLHPGTPQPQIIPSPIHHNAELCWTCHDVSNPLMTKQGDGTYAINATDAAHPTHQQTDMLPLHRTYSEWKNSYYSSIGVQHNGRFGGNHLTNPEFIANGTAGVMKSCQDCHMPDVDTFGCNFEFPPFFQRPDNPQHSFMGSNTWVLNAIRTMDADGNSQPDFPDAETGMNDELVAGAIARNVDFLERASDLELTKVGSNLRTRILNRTGHKMPTGYPDGRRIWINVKFLDCNDTLIQEHGAYDFGTGELTQNDTKVYEIELGISGADYAQSIGHPEGRTFHFMLANTIIKDNRIPPAGFSNFVAIQNQSAPVGATYVNGQHWDDTLFAVPDGTRTALVTVYYQLNSKEFIEHLRDDNTTNTQGQVAYDLWVQYGMSTPVVIDSMEMAYFHPADVNEDGVIDVNDLLTVVGGWGACPPSGPCDGDVTGDGLVDVNDLLAVIGAWGPC